MLFLTGLFLLDQTLFIIDQIREDQTLAFLYVADLYKESTI